MCTFVCTHVTVQSTQMLIWIHLHKTSSLCINLLVGSLLEVANVRSLCSMCMCVSIDYYLSIRDESILFDVIFSFPIYYYTYIYIYTLTIVLWSIDWSFQLSLVHSFIRSFFPIIESTGNYDSFIRPTYGISLHWWTHTHTRILF